MKKNKGRNMPIFDLNTNEAIQLKKELYVQDYDY